MNEEAARRRYGPDPHVGEVLKIMGVRAPGSPQNPPFPCFIRERRDGGGDEKVAVRSGLSVRICRAAVVVGTARIESRSTGQKGFGSELFVCFVHTGEHAGAIAKISPADAEHLNNPSHCEAPLRSLAEMYSNLTAEVLAV